MTTVQANGPTGTDATDKSIASATGASQTIAAANPGRREIVITNIDATDWWINPTGGTAVADTAGSFKLRSLDTTVLANTDKITGIGTAASKLTAWER